MFRVDASLRIGTGHVMRSLCLAQILAERGFESLFIQRAHDGHQADAIRAQGHAVVRLPAPGAAPEVDANGDFASWLGVPAARDAEETKAALDEAFVDWLVVDHYAIDACWEALLRDKARRLLVIDDLADRAHDCDVLLDQTHGRSPEDYVDRVPRHCELRLGASHALLRPEFSVRRPATLERRDQRQGGIDRVLVCMGGMDPDNATEVALRSIARSGLDVAVDVIMGGSAPYLDELRQTWGARLGVRLHIDTEYVADLMAAADVAIGAGGTTSWERCCLGLPTLAVLLADNQRLIIRSLARAGAVADMGSLEPGIDARLAETLVELDRDPARLYAMSTAARHVCDGEGARRLADRICETEGGQVSA